MQGQCFFIPVWVEKSLILEIDETNIADIDLFRLAERSLIVFVSEKVKTAIEAAKHMEIELVKPGELDCFSDTT